ncbi:MAG TPA: rhodanese-like domain-containing protein [Rhizobacter sp.]|nr:rhodanese-like domain-containing protein [Rhizobacter sp.]
MPSVFHIAFYRFAALQDPPAVAANLRLLAADLLGSVLVAHEGINGVLAGEAAALDAFEQALQQDARFTGMAFKRSACKTPPFARLKVHVKPEIVAVGVPGGGASPGTQVDPAAWRELIARDDVVVLDNRNSFEYRLGRFRNAIDPGVSSFRDFPRYVEAHAEQWKREGKTVAMYCTGGIRCEKTSAWMQGLGLQVRELDGGILNYFQSLPDAAREWEGECFVFDNRIALDTHLQETGTTAEQVYAGEPDGEWRLQRARRLDESV